MELELSEDRIVSSQERRTLIPYSDMHIWRLEQAGQFPKRIHLGSGLGGRVGWSMRELQDWIAARKAERTPILDDEDEAPPSMVRGRNGQNLPSESSGDNNEPGDEI